MDHALPALEVLIEIPRGSFIKRRSDGQVDFFSPIPCPFNYGSIPAFIGLDGDYLDAVVLGPKLAAGTRHRVTVWRAVAMIDQGQRDDKIICSNQVVAPWKQRGILGFFLLYAKAKWLINRYRGSQAPTRCEGWLDPATALARAKPKLQAYN